jgi:serine/threonine-protein kinase
MSPDDHSRRLSDLIDSVADGRSVDWDAAGAAPADDRIRRLLEMLRIVDGIADVHRSEVAVPEDEAPTRPGAGTEDSTIDSELPPTDPRFDRWGHFELLRKLGEGTFGEVYHARDAWLNQSRALKLAKPIVDRKRFLHEARTLAQIRHPNVVVIHGADEHRGRAGFWMDLIEGPTLAEVIENEGVRSPTEAALIGRDLCRAMAAVHATDIVHRDIKAQNVIRQSQTGQIILMDFGAGEAMDANRAGRRPTGTPLYLAPELFDGRVATRETDIYALGVLLFHLVTRSYPVYGENMEALKRAHRRGDRHHLGDMRPDLPDDFVRVVETMIAPDPAKRFHSATEARKALEEVVAPHEYTPPPPQPNRWLHRAYVAAVSMAITIAALIIIGAVSTGWWDVTFSSGSFDNSTPLDWFTVGRKVVLAPVVRLAILVMPVVLLVAAALVFCRLVPPVGRRLSRLGVACHGFLQSRELYDPSLIVLVIAGLGAAAFGAFALFHWSDVTIFAMFADQATPERLAMLQPANEPHYDAFQRQLEYLLLVYGLIVYAVYSSVRRSGSRVRGATWAYVIAVPAIAFLSMRAAPWMIVYGNDRPRMDYGMMRCYELGRRADETLVFCPDDNPPRVQRHKTTELQDRGFLENVFTPRSQARVFAPTSP